MRTQHVCRILGLAVCAATLRAQEARVAAPTVLSPYLVALSVANLDSSVAWYRTMLGFQVMPTAFGPVRDLRVAFLRREDFRLELLEARNSRSRRVALPDSSSDISLQGFTKLAFTVSDLSAAADRFRQHGVPFVFGPAVDSAFRVRHFIVADPDGNLLQFFQPFP